MVTKQTKQAVGAAALAAAAAGAAGYYFYASKDAKKNRRIAAKWAQDMKRDIEKRAKKLKDLDRDEVISLIEQGAAAYGALRSIEPKELTRAVGELKKNWKEFRDEIQPVKNLVRKKAKAKKVKRAVKKPKRNR